MSSGPTTRVLAILAITLCMARARGEAVEEFKVETSNLRLAAADDRIAITTQDDVAYVLHWDSGELQWVEEGTLTPVGGEPFVFGDSIAAWGEVVVIGDPYQEDSFLEPATGAAYVFRFDDETEEWYQEQRILRDDGATYTFFGSAVAVEGDRLLIGRAGGVYGGWVYEFRWDDAALEWAETEEFQADGLEIGDRFGVRLAMSGDFAAVVAKVLHFGSGIGMTSGKVYLFSHNSDLDEWIEGETLESEYEDDSFGWSVALAGTVLAVAAPHDDTIATNAGAVYVYRFDETRGSWGEPQVLTASDASEGDEFGWSIALHGEMLVVGAPSVENEEGILAGAAYLFEWSSAAGQWVEVGRLDSSDGQADWRQYAWSVAANGNVAVVGAPAAQAVYIFDPRVRDFLRGDVSGDGVTQGLLDALYLLTWGFLGGDSTPCREAADVNDDGAVSPLLDALALLEWAFSLGGEDPPSPGPTKCGIDATENLGCTTPPDVCAD